jgi:hypothetical protein
MREPAANLRDAATRLRRGAQGHGRIVILVLTCLFLGFTFGAWWHYRTTRQGLVDATPVTDGKLSDGTRAVLQRLDSPIEIRFYAVLDQAGGFDALRAFAGRVDQLLSEFQKEANAKIRVIRYHSRSDSATASASADGLRPFNLDKGDACYLGIIVAQEARKESLPQFSPEWEPALEFDLSRAIARVISANRPAERPATPPSNAAVTEEVRTLIPDPVSVSLEEGTRILREKAMTEFAATTEAMEAQVKEAEQRFLQAQRDNSEAAQQAARKELQEVRTQQTEKLKQIAARLHDQIAALEQLKKK